MNFAAKNHRFGEKTATFAKKLANFLKNSKFDENFEIRERCKGVHCVDLGESFPTSIFLQNLVSIQLKTSPETSKFDFRITQRFNFPMVFSPGSPQPQPCQAFGTFRKTKHTFKACLQPYLDERVWRYKDFVLYVRDGSDKIFKPRGFVPPGWAPKVCASS